MKMRKFKSLFVITLFISFMATTTHAVTIGIWIQNPYEGRVSGNWTDANMWVSSSNARPPIPTANTGDEVKLITPYATSTINSEIGNYNCKFTVAGGMNTLDVHTVLMQAGSVGIGQFQVGHGSVTDKGQWGKVVQSGGTVSAEKLILGYYGTRGTAHGEYIISGGTLQSNSGISGNTDRLLVGCGMTTGSTTANNEGILTIVGNDANISMKELYVGGYSYYVGTGTVAFQADEDGVSPIKVSNSINLSAAGIANLVVSNSGYLGTIVLIKNTGTGSAVSVLFDSLNGGGAGSADEGAVVYAGGRYTLTYTYDADGDGKNNDIALIPEPATIALLSLGLIAIRRKK